MIQGWFCNSSISLSFLYSPKIATIQSKKRKEKSLSVFRTDEIGKGLGLAIVVVGTIVIGVCWLRLVWSGKRGEGEKKNTVVGVVAVAAVGVLLGTDVVHVVD